MEAVATTGGRAQNEGRSTVFCAFASDNRPANPIKRMAAIVAMAD